MRKQVPTYELYGEYLAGSYVDPAHHETIRERSIQHDWTIRMHKHKRLAQIFIFETPGIRIRVGDSEYFSTGPLAMLVPPQVAHGFRFSEDVVGDVITLPVEFIDEELCARMERIAKGGVAIVTPQQTRHFEVMRTVMAQLAEAFRSMGPDRTLLLAALSRLLMIYLTADLGAQLAVAAPVEDTEPSRHEAQAQAFCDAVEQHFAEPLPVPEYAARLGMSAPHLTRVCKRILGATPNEIIRQRRMVEAKRLLRFTRHPVADIALRAGFKDAAFFCRSFKQQTGTSPTGFRAQDDA